MEAKTFVVDAFYQLYILYIYKKNSVYFIIIMSAKCLPCVSKFTLD